MDISSKLEALLFVYGEPVKTQKLAEILGVSVEDVTSGLSALKDKLLVSHSGLELIVSDNKAMLSTRAELGELVKRAVKDELDTELTPASIETLSIIAYLAPVSRATIEYIRGVNSSFMLRNLMVRGLIARDLEKDKTPMYKPTFDFLRHVGVDSPERLPDYEKYKEVVRNFMRQGDNGHQS